VASLSLVDSVFGVFGKDGYFKIGPRWLCYLFINEKVSSMGKDFSGREDFFFHFSFVPAEHIPFKFPMGSQCVPQGCFQVVFGVESELIVQCSLSTWTVDIPCKFCILFFLNCVFGGGMGVKAKSSEVPDMFSKEFAIAPHFYPICFGKCCPHSWAKGWGTLHFKIEPFILGNLHSLSLLSDGPIKLVHCKKIIIEFETHFI